VSNKKNKQNRVIDSNGEIMSIERDPSDIIDKGTDNRVRTTDTDDNNFYVNPLVNKNEQVKEKIISSGGMLTGQAIIDAVKKGEIVIDGFNPKNINPNSYNLTLSPLLKVYENKILDFRGKNPTNRIIIPEKGLILQPGELYIGATNERTFSDTYIPNLEGRSTCGRLGLTVHITAGFGDLGFDGTWTLEITVEKPLIIYPNIEICQISYFTPYGPTNIKYDGRYQGQVEPVEARGEYNKKVYVE